jgi:hypothetical protein
MTDFDFGDLSFPGSIWDSNTPSDLCQFDEKLTDFWDSCDSPLTGFSPIEQAPSSPLPVPSHTPVVCHRRTASEPAIAPTFIAPPSVHVRAASIPLPILGTDQFSRNLEFISLCSDKSVTFNPHKLGFVPVAFWKNRDYTFGELVQDFFQKKCNVNTRFSHKLFNALKIAESDPFYIDYLGVEWVTDSVLKVRKNVFARLLGIKTVDGSLFHQQGNFPSHGFMELGVQEARECVQEADMQNVDFEEVRLLAHHSGEFARNADPENIEGCKWVNSRKKV